GQRPSNMNIAYAVIGRNLRAKRRRGLRRNACVYIRAGCHNSSALRVSFAVALACIGSFAERCCS
ncbi:MAG: hypothetical protein ACXWC1_34160, partial [Burkholderiales bacterium]